MNLLLLFSLVVSTAWAVNIRSVVPVGLLGSQAASRLRSNMSYKGATVASTVPPATPVSRDRSLSADEHKMLLRHSVL